MAEWLKIQNKLTEEGYNSKDIQGAKDTMMSTLRTEGYQTKEINSFFGIKNPSMSGARKVIQGNIKRFKETGEVTEASTWLEAVEAGWDMSVVGLAINRELPDVVLPENASMFHSISAQVSTLAGDAVPMVVGGGIGFFAGRKFLGPFGGKVLAGAGAFALPAAMREVLMQHYEKGDVRDFADFWERTAAVLTETAKAAAIGAATIGVGAGVAKVVGKTALAQASKIVTPIAVTTAEIGTMVTVGAAMEGEIPEPEHFLEAAILIGGLKGTIKVGKQLRNVYKKTAIKPEQAALEAQVDPVLKADLASSEIKVPERYKKNIELPELEPKKVDLQLEAIKKSEKFNKTPDTIEIEKITEKDLKPKVEIKVEKEIDPVTKKEQITPEQEIKDSIEFEPVREAREFKGDEYYTKFVDDLHPLKQLTKAMSGDKIKFEEDPYVLARLTRGDFGRADQMIERGVFDFKTQETVGKGLMQILDPVRKNLETFEAYAKSVRSIELEARGVESGIRLKAAQKVVAKNKKAFEKPFREIVEYQNQVLNYLKDSGVISADLFKKVTEINKSYVPMNRITGDKNIKSAGTGLRVNNPIKGIKGSKKKTASVIETIVRNTYLYVKLAERNRVMTSLVKLAKENPLSKDFMERVPTPLKPIKITEPEIKKFFGELGIEADAEMLTVFRPKSVGLRADEVAIFVEGKREVWRVPDEVAKAINGLDPPSVGLVIKILAAPARTLRAGVTLVPEFGVKNFFRDQISAVILAPRGFVPVYDSLVGLGSIITKGKAYQNWLKNGGANSALVSLDRDYIKNKISRLSKETGLMDKTWNVIKNPFEMARATSELMENATRVGVFRRTALRGAGGVEAAFGAREGTLDFQRIGSKMRAANMITAFLNVGIQGPDRTFRAFKDRPLATTARVMAMVTVPSVLLWWANHKDPRWKQIPRWQKDNFWIIMTDEHVFRAPKPFELGILFGSLPERVLEAYFTDNPDAFKEFEETLLAGAFPNYIPTFAAPIIEQFANKSTFTGRAIIPWRVEGLMPEYQYSDYTSETAKQLGHLIAAVPGFKDSQAASPAVIQNYIRAWTGGVGAYALKLGDQALFRANIVPEPVRPIATLADMPIIRAFVIRHPSATAQSIQDFYNKFAEKQKAIKTIRALAQRGDFKAVQRELFLDENRGKFIQLTGIAGSLSNLHKMIALINQNPEITPLEKRQLIDGSYYQMIEIAKFGNQIISDFEKAEKEAAAQRQGLKKR